MANEIHAEHGTLKHKAAIITLLILSLVCTMFSYCLCIFAYASYFSDALPLILLNLLPLLLLMLYAIALYRKPKMQLIVTISFVLLAALPLLNSVLCNRDVASACAAGFGTYIENGGCLNFVFNLLFSASFAVATFFSLKGYPQKIIVVIAAAAATLGEELLLGMIDPVDGFDLFSLVGHIMLYIALFLLSCNKPVHIALFLLSCNKLVKCTCSKALSNDKKTATQQSKNTVDDIKLF